MERGCGLQGMRRDDPDRCDSFLPVSEGKIYMRIMDIITTIIVAMKSVATRGHHWGILGTLYLITLLIRFWTRFLLLQKLSLK
jgi:hypothetical protein